MAYIPESDFTDVGPSPRMLQALFKKRLRQQRQAQLDELWLYDELVGYACFPHRGIVESVCADLNGTIPEELTWKSQRPLLGSHLKGSRPADYQGECPVCEPVNEANG